MAGRIWDDVVPERDRQVFAEAGYGKTGGFGQRPALIVVDVTYDFCGTPLLSYLVALGCDSVIVTGTSTSGCVRGTVIDAFSNNLAVSVVEECCFDRLIVSHKINLFDMHGKYADVVSTDETVAYFD